MRAIPLNELPETEAGRHAALRDYFCDKDAIVMRSGETWTLSLAWPADPRRHVDLGLARGLSWWHPGLRFDAMWSSQRRSGRLLTSLYDTWTVVSWSQWLSSQSQIPQDVVILHVDDHRDMGSPRYATSPEGHYDLITGHPVLLNDPASVKRSLESGALGMGSFMTPFLAAIPSATVRHLCQPPKATETVDKFIHLQTRPDTLLEPGAARIDIAVSEKPSTRTYRCSPNVGEWLTKLPDGPILLHIDMDYFCNRFDGDTDWASNAQRLDPKLVEINAKIDELNAALADYGLRDRVEDATISFSPGFFPAEFWQPAYDRLVAPWEQWR